jgi:hypothetical protein
MRTVKPRSEPADEERRDVSGGVYHLPRKSVKASQRDDPLESCLEAHREILRGGDSHRWF